MVVFVVEVFFECVEEVVYFFFEVFGDVFVVEGLEVGELVGVFVVDVVV